MKPPDCPICERPATPHCNLVGCILFECLPCDIWGGRHTAWTPRPSPSWAKKRWRKK